MVAAVRCLEVTVDKDDSGFVVIQFDNRIQLGVGAYVAEQPERLLVAIVGRRGADAETAANWQAQGIEEFGIGGVGDLGAVNSEASQ